MKLIQRSSRTLSIGDIVTSRFWFSVEHRAYPVRVSFFHIGPTYNGTRTGLAIGRGNLVILAHIRGGRLARATINPIA